MKEKASKDEGSPGRNRISRFPLRLTVPIFIERNPIKTPLTRAELVVTPAAMTQNLILVVGTRMGTPV
ncbi:MAG: hypothetical protein MUC58_08590 [Rhizobiaceae bacterium]|jgi:hypothetical protein|nr:hypothetical protein [Rhizobiaceae bacterium]